MNNLPEDCAEPLRIAVKCDPRSQFGRATYPSVRRSDLRDQPGALIDQWRTGASLTALQEDLRVVRGPQGHLD